MSPLPLTPGRRQVGATKSFLLARTATRITDDYLKLLADWIKDDVRGVYGRAEKFSPR